MAVRTSLSYLFQVSLLMVIIIFPVLLINSVSSSESPYADSIVAEDPPLSIILMIGDGMGYEHVELARIVEEGMSGSLDMQIRITLLLGKMLNHKLCND